MIKHYTWYNTNVYDGLTKEQKRHNALNIHNYFTGQQRWRVEATAALLGNMSAESKMSPTQWEGGTEYGRGYGLVQWTPYTLLSEWATDNDLQWEGPEAGTTELLRIQYEYDKKLEFYPSKKDPIADLAPDWETFAHAEVSKPTSVYPDPEPLTVEILTQVFLFNYLRPADPYASLNNRVKAAKLWYDYIIQFPPVRDPVLLVLFKYYLQKHKKRRIQP